MRNTVRMRNTGALSLALVIAGTTGCSYFNNTAKAGAVGAAAGGVVGAVIGNNTGSTARGAIIGAVAGGTVGAIIGARMDRQAEELAAEIPNATVERVGEGVLVTFDSGLLFDFDSDVVRGAARDNLTELAASLKKYSESDVLIVGHTDAVGTDSYNQALSERRADSASRYLRSQGVDAARVRTEGMGELEPVATNDSEAGRSQNRRVEVAIYASEEYKARLVKANGGGR
jgi:outer membrane protein OmpA-like peptidoglycan-associated protein